MSLPVCGGYGSPARIRRPQCVAASSGLNETEFEMKKTIILSGPSGLLLASGLLLVASAGVAVAAMGGGHHGPRAGQMFEMMDLNKDGEITKEEAETAGAQRFSEADADGDGFISPEEMQARMAARIEDRQKALFEHKDTDKDGRLSQEEMTGGEGGKRLERMFDRLDANDDGKITRAEADAARERMRERRGRHSDDD